MSASAPTLKTSETRYVTAKGELRRRVAAGNGRLGKGGRQRGIGRRRQGALSGKRPTVVPREVDARAGDVDVVLGPVQVGDRLERAGRHVAVLRGAVVEERVVAGTAGKGVDS